MEERIKNIVFICGMFVCLMLFFMTVIIAGYTKKQTQKILDRIEQLEAQIDRIERTN